jgi:hypothetical protein
MGDQVWSLVYGRGVSWGAVIKRVGLRGVMWYYDGGGWLCLLG